MPSTERAPEGRTAGATARTRTRESVRARKPACVYACGFTLVELTVSIVLLGIVALLAANFSAGAMQIYLDAQRRAHLTDTTGTALRRLQVELRGALPNSIRIIRIGPAVYLEFLPVLAKGHYRAQPAGAIPPGTCGIGRDDPLNFGISDHAFSTLGPVAGLPAPGNGAETRTGTGTGTGIGTGSPPGVRFYVVVNNLGAGFADADADVYASGIAAGGNKSPLTTSASGPCESTVGFSRHAFPRPSPSGRFHIIGRPVTYACNPVTGQLLRYADYDISPTQPTPPATAPARPPALALDQLTACSIAYEADASDTGNTRAAQNRGDRGRSGDAGQRGSSRNGRVAITLVRTVDGEAVRLHQELHVDNTP